MNPLPDGVKLRPDGGGFRFVTQRGYFAPPFTSCMFAALAAVQEEMGLDVPLPRAKANTPPENYVLTLHKASGAPLSRGTTTRESQKALQQLFPYGSGVHFGRADDAGLFQLLMQGNAVRLTVNCGKLPKRLKRWIGFGYNGGHAIWIGRPGGANGFRRVAGVAQVYWCDPMGRPGKGYKGEWVNWADVSPAIHRADGRIVAAWGRRGEAERAIMDEMQRQLEAAEAANAELTEQNARLTAELATAREPGEKLADSVEAAVTTYRGETP